MDFLSGYLPEACGSDADFQGRSSGDEECVEVGMRVFAWYQDAWYAGEVMAAPDEDEEKRWTVQCDVDDYGIYTYSHHVVLSLDEDAGDYEAASPCSKSGVRSSKVGKLRSMSGARLSKVGKLLLPSVLPREADGMIGTSCSSPRGGMSDAECVKTDGCNEELTPTCASSASHSRMDSDDEDVPSFCMSDDEESLHFEDSGCLQDLPLATSEESLCLEDLPLATSEQRFASVSEAHEENGSCHFEEEARSTSEQRFASVSETHEENGRCYLEEEPRLEPRFTSELSLASVCLASVSETHEENSRCQCEEEPYSTSEQQFDKPAAAVECAEQIPVETEQPFRWKIPPLPASLLSDEADDCTDLFDELRFLNLGLADDAEPPARHHRAATKMERRARRCQVMLRQTEAGPRKGGRLLRAMIQTANLDQP